MNLYFKEYYFYLFLFINYLIKPKRVFNEDFVLVTASDKNHYIYLNNLIKNYKKNPKIFKKIYVYDIGLEKEQIAKLNSQEFIEYRKFDFSAYPVHFSKRLNHHGNKIGGFAWKPSIIKQVLNEKVGHVVWFDSANLFTKKIIFFKLYICHFGFLSFHSTGTIQNWTHKKVTDSLISNENKLILNKKNLMGGVVGVNYLDRKACKLIEDWSELAKDESLIFPKESNLSNHRHDQSLLSILYWLSYKKELPVYFKKYGVTIQNWPNKILYFFDDYEDTRTKLLERFKLESTTTNKRAKILILMNPSSLSKIPFRLLLSKKVILLIFQQHNLREMNRYILKKRLAKILINQNINSKKRFIRLPLTIDNIINFIEKEKNDKYNK